MIMTSEIAADNLAEMIAFYKTHFLSVEKVTCTKCKELLVLEMYGNGDTMGIAPDGDGKIRINVGNALISYRVRLDETPEGTPMIGYQCECGNDTRISEIEEVYMPESPANRGPSTLDPFTRQKIKELIKASDYKPKYKDLGKHRMIETFKIEKV